ncbi:unnamed protein product [Ostreobium quekettii]|uniref:Uncharacterized protein n=1 Tax=Ostreobium quekettii TaxID=121088 RepID=A0A8S1IUN9_9CHLO|nr:unnamed protein product [Ostreobium quekettii]
MLNAADLNTLAHPSQNFCPPASAPDHPAILQHPGLASKRACAKSDGGAARERPISGSRQRADRSGKEVGGGRRDRDPGAGANCNRRRAKSQRPGTPAGGHRRQSSAAPSGSRSRDFMAECHAIFRLPRTHSRRVMFTAGVTASIGGPASGRGARALASLPGFGAEFAPPRPQAASCLLGGGEARRDASPGILDGFEPVGHDDPEFMRAGKRCRMSELGRRLGLEEPFPRDCGGIDWKDILAEGSDASPSTEGATTDDAAEAPPDPATEGRGVQIQDSGRRRGRPPREAGAGGKRRKTRRYTRKPKLDTLLTKLVRCTRVYKVACEHGKKEQHDYIEDINCLRRLVQDLESYKNQAQPKPGSQISVTEQNVFLGGLRFILEWARDAWALHAAELRKEAARKRGR